MFMGILDRGTWQCRHVTRCVVRRLPGSTGGAIGRWQVNWQDGSVHQSDLLRTGLPHRPFYSSLLTESISHPAGVVGLSEAPFLRPTPAMQFCAVTWLSRAVQSIYKCVEEKIHFDQAVIWKLAWGKESSWCARFRGTRELAAVDVPQPRQALRLGD